MANSFIITINCSKILCDSEEYQFAMLIDHSKMTIVYELIEWIRWIFSLDECFYLTHNNSVIHEFEDIGILSTLKNFEIKPCRQFGCIHKNIYKTLSSKLNLFVSWKDISVPKIFLEKLSLIEQKLNKQNQLSTNDKNKQVLTQVSCSQTGRQETKERNLAKCESTSTPQKEMCSDSNGEYFEQCKNFKSTCLFKSFKENKLNKIPITKHAGIDKSTEMHSVDKSTEVSTNSLEEGFNKNKLERSFDTSDNNNFNSNLDSSLLNKTSSSLHLHKNSHLPNIEKFNSPVEDHQKNNNKFELKDDKDFSMNKSKKVVSGRFTKPFSLGQILSNLRDECKSKTIIENNCNGEPNVYPSLCENNFSSEKKCGETPTDSFSDDFKTVEKRKRKRTRRSRSSKKQEEAKELDNLNTSQTANFKWNIKRPLDETKPNHIRFNLEDGDKYMETDQYETNGPKRERLSNINESSHLEFEKTNVEDLVSMINEKKQALSGSNMQSTSVECDQMTEITKNHIQTQKDFVILEGEGQSQTTLPYENLESNGFNKDLSTLMQLKERFPSPVVIERFF